MVVGLGISVSFNWTGRLQAEPPPKLSPKEVDEELKQLERQSWAVAALAARVKPAVVTIYTTKIVRTFEDPEFDPFSRYFEVPREFRRSGLGSGVIVHSDGKTGIVLTNYHVAEGQDELKVKLSDDREFDAKVRGADRKTDLAVLAITGSDLPVAKLGDSDDVRAGEMVMAIGSPFGLEQTVTIGHVSAKGRKGFSRSRYKYENYIQIDAAINPGNSGGPLINLRGEVIGINTMIITPSGVFAGVGLAIPSNMAKGVMEDIVRDGKVTRAYLGIVLEPLNKEVAEALKIDGGVQVRKVVPGDPAEQTGIKDGDVLVEFNGWKITDVDEFRSRVARTKIGSTVPVKLLRGNQTLTVNVTLTEQPDEVAEGPQAPGGPLGLTVQDLTPELGENLGHKGHKGVLVVRVDPNGPAARANPPVREGDLIQQVAQKPVTDVASFNAAVAAARKAGHAKAIILLVRSRGDGGTHYVVVKPRGR
jgi:serine protease Do